MSDSVEIIYLGEKLDRGGVVLDSSPFSVRFRVFDYVDIEPGMIVEAVRLSSTQIRIIISKPEEKVLPKALGINVKESLELVDALA